MMKIENILYLPSGRIFLVNVDDYLIECTEMRDVSVDGKLHEEVRNTQDLHIIWNHLVPYYKKWLLTVSTQKGCSFNCKFCDVANMNFKGNLTQEEIENQIKILLKESHHLKYCEKVKIGFARMGEPSCNFANVFEVISNLYNISESLNRNFKWLPCFNTILPKKCDNILDAYSLLDGVLYLKEEIHKGFLHLQISCNSTDENQRKLMFSGANVLEIENIVKYINKQTITNRTVTLNFIVMDGIEVDVQKLKKMGLNKDKFTVKLIPLNNTKNADLNNLKTYANYRNYDKLLELKDSFEKEGIPVVIDAIAKCEEAGLCCGQLAQIFMKNPCQ